jgi:cytochrome b involved in lipid metabolism
MRKMQTPIISQQLEDATKVMYSREEVAKHTQDGDIWVIIENDVYDLSSFLQEHPGGAKSMFSETTSPMWTRNLIKSTVLQGVAGQDATKKFKKYHRLGILSRYKERLRLGGLEQTTGVNGTTLRSSFTSIFRRS